MESGSDKILERIQKGATSKTHISGGRKVVEAGLELSMYYLSGIGGMELYEEHALESARVLNAVNPAFIRVRTLVPHEDSLMLKWYRQGEIQLQEPYDALKELRLLIENLDVSSRFLSDHSYNFLNVEGQLPGDKEYMLSFIDYGLSLPRDRFRQLFVGTTG